MMRRFSAAISAALLALGARAQVQPSDLLRKFEDFLREFGKSYQEEAEYQARFAAFAENVRYTEAENAKGTNTFQLGLTEFADMTSEEFRTTYLGYKPPTAAERWGAAAHLGTFRARSMTESLPTSVDWRAHGAVTPVKNQGRCGSCWAFSTTGALEGAYQIASGKLVSLSEQQLVDCAQSFGEHGCHGGQMDSGFEYARKNGLDTEESYSYKASDGICKASSGTAGLPAGAVTGYHDVAKDDEQALMQAVMAQPVSIAIEADKSVFQLYKGGVLSGACGTSLDHGVLLVGYGTEKSQPYWLIKNSWGTSWGEEGFGKLLRGNQSGSSGECGIKMNPSFPVVTASPGPAPGPSPPPSPPSPSTPHYEKPPCQADEKEVRVQGFQGVTCSPECQGTSCPGDVPPGTTALPRCVLRSPSGDSRCALTCMSGGCPPGATCQRRGTFGPGLCMYSDTAPEERSRSLRMALAEDDDINIV